MANKLMLLSYSIKDIFGVRGQFKSYWDVPEATNLTTLQTFTDTITGLVDAITDGEIVNITIRLYPDIAGAKDAPTAGGSPIEFTGLFDYLLNTAGDRHDGVDVPAFAKSKVVTGKINTADTAVAAFFDEFNTGVASFSAVNANSIGLLVFQFCRLTTRKQRKVENHVSTEPAP